MEELINKITSLRHGDISRTVAERIKEFKQFNRESNNELFKELCYCILTARSSAEKCLEICNNIKDGFLTDSREELAMRLKRYSYPLARQRANYISNALTKKDQLKEAVQSLHGEELRDWIKKNIKGIGYKEASHFLRNIGFDDYAIIDSHIINRLVDHNLIERPKPFPQSKKRYLEIESLLREIAEKSDVALAELDLYLWYMETDKVLK